MTRAAEIIAPKGAEELSRKNRLFVDCLIETGSREQAVKAYGSKSTGKAASVIAVKILARPEVTEMIHERLDELARTRMAQDRLAVARSRAPDIIDRLDKMAMGEIEGAKPSDQLAAAKEILRMRGVLGAEVAMTMNTAVQVNNSVALQFEKLFGPENLAKLTDDDLEQLRRIANRLEAPAPIEGEYREVPPYDD